MPRSSITELADSWLRKDERADAYLSLAVLIDEHPSDALQVIEEIQFRLSNDGPNYAELGVLAAGPLESLLVRHGPAIIEKVEHLAQREPDFRKCLAGVWIESIDSDVASRIQRYADPTWKFR
jgi:hypothetical protein